MNERSIPRGRRWAQLRLVVFGCGILLALSNRASATSYTPQFSTGEVWSLSAYHWDQYLFRYNPETGWTSVLTAGDAGGLAGHVTVLSDDGSGGQIVNIKLVFDVSIDLHYSLYNKDLDLLSEAAAIANFGGMDAGKVINEFGLQGDGLIEPWQRQPLPGGAFGSSVIEMSTLVPYRVGYTDYPDNGLPPRFEITLGHNGFDPTGLHVFDESLPALFGIDIDVSVTLKDVTVVPETGQTGALLLAAISGLVLLGRRMKRSVTWV